MTKDRRLGKGLAALLGTPMEDEDGGVSTAAPLAETATADREPRGSGLATTLEDALNETDDVEASGELLELAVDDIEQNPFQPRREFNESEIASLAESLKRHEMLMPVLVRPVGDSYQLISGERRLRAAMLAGWTTIPARVREADDRVVAELAIVENVQRKDLNPIEKALSFKRYLEQYQCTQEDLAQRLKIDRSTVANLVRLLELPEVVLQAVQTGDISAGHARALLPLGDSKAQIEFARRIATEGISVRETERTVAERIRSEDGPRRSKKTKKAKARSSQVASLEQELKRVLGTKVEIQEGARNKGKIVVHFQNHTEFDRLWEYLVGEDDVARAA